mgnify:CR=1 FL=1
MIGNDIFFWENLTEKEFACPCYIHGASDGIYNWGSYQSEEASFLQGGATAILGGCNIVNSGNLFNEGGPSVLYNEPTEEWWLTFGVEPEPIGGGPNDFTIGLAPGILIPNGVTITIDLTLKTTSCIPHRFTLNLAPLDTSGSGRGFANLGSLTSVLAVNDFATSAMTGVTGCSALGAGNFATNGEETVVTDTFTNSTGSAIVRWLVLNDLSVTGGLTASSNVHITNIQVTYSMYGTDSNSTPPIFSADITANSNIASPNGAIAIDNTITDMNDANCWWCWSDRFVFQGTSPDRTGLSHGWYALKMFSLTEQRSYPIQLMNVPYYNAATILTGDGDFNHWYRAGIYSKKGDQLHGDISNGKKSNALNLLAIDIIKYLWEKSGALDACMTDGYIDTFENYLTEEFNTCTASGNLGFLGPYNSFIPNPPEMSGDVDLEGFVPTPPVFNEGDWIDDGEWAGMPPQGINEASLWKTEGLVWNKGSDGFVNNNGNCCYGYVDYPYPSYVYHNKRIWEPRSETSDTRTQPGSFLGASHWKLTKASSKRSVKNNLEILKLKRKSNIFELERDGMPSRGPAILSLNTYGGDDSQYITLENTKLLKPEKSKNKLIV